MPIKIHSFFFESDYRLRFVLIFLSVDVDWRAYDPNELLHEDYFNSFGEERHATGGSALLGALGLYPLAVSICSFLTCVR